MQPMKNVSAMVAMAKFIQIASLSTNRPKNAETKMVGIIKWIV